MAKLNPFAPLLFDTAVTTCGRIIENALQEMMEVGSGDRKRSVQKYRITELLDDRFKFPDEDDLAIFKGLDIYEEVC